VPQDLDTLFSIDEIKSDFQNFEVIELEGKEIQLNEGQFHNGLVIRFVGRKNNRTTLKLSLCSKVYQHDKKYSFKF
jgi:hypothetical protein